jgi:hypothetical protein
VEAEVAEGRLREIDADLRNLDELHMMRMQSNPDAAMVRPSQFQLDRQHATRIPHAPWDPNRILCALHGAFGPQLNQGP